MSRITWPIVTAGLVILVVYVQFFPRPIRSQAQETDRIPQRTVDTSAPPRNSQAPRSSTGRDNVTQSNFQPVEESPRKGLESVEQKVVEIEKKLLQGLKAATTSLGQTDTDGDLPPPPPIPTTPGSVPPPTVPPPASLPTVPPLPTTGSSEIPTPTPIAPPKVTSSTTSNEPAPLPPPLGPSRPTTANPPSPTPTGSYLEVPMTNFGPYLENKAKGSESSTVPPPTVPPPTGLETKPMLTTGGTNPPPAPTSPVAPPPPVGTTPPPPPPPPPAPLEPTPPPPVVPAKAVVPPPSPEHPMVKANTEIKVTSPWTFHLEIIEGKNILTAKVGRSIQFKVTCDKCDMQSPHGTIQAAGNVRINSSGLEAVTEKMTINLQEDAMVLEGKAQLKCVRDEQEIELRSDRFSLRLSEIQNSSTGTSSLQRPPAIRFSRETSNEER